MIDRFTSTHSRLYLLPTMVAQLQSDVHALRMSSPVHPNPVIGTRQVRRWTAKFMNTEVPKFRGNTCWNQHRQVFDAIIKSNGWNDDTAALQQITHLEGDALNVGCLIGARDTNGHAKWIGRCLKRPLWIAGKTGGLPTLI